MQFKLKNFTVDFFNNDVNNSTDQNERYQKWSGYRRKITEFVAAEVSKNMTNGRAIVFGAGALNDVDLSFLCDAFEEVVLTDIDEKSMHAGIERQNLTKEERSKITTVKMDCSGVQTAGLFDKLEEMAAKSSSPAVLTEFMTTAISLLRPDYKKAERLGEFDFVLSCPVYTQLVYTQIEFFLKILYDCGLYEYEDLNRILAGAHKAMRPVICNYNDLLISRMKDDSVIAVFTDIAEISTDNGKLNIINKLLQADNVDYHEVERYVSENGLEFAILGRDDLKSKVQIYKQMYTMWPFDETKEYLCLGMLGRKKI